MQTCEVAGGSGKADLTVLNINGLMAVNLTEVHDMKDILIAAAARSTVSSVAVQQNKKSGGKKAELPPPPSADA